MTDRIYCATKEADDLLIAAGYEPENTESAARRIAEFAAEQMAVMRRKRDEAISYVESQQRNNEQFLRSV